MGTTKKTARRQRKNSYSPDHVKRFHESGLTKSEYSRQNGIHANVLSRWIARYNEESEDGDFVRIEQQRLMSFDEQHLEIILPDGIRIKGVERSSLGEIVKTIRGLSDVR